MKTLKQLQEEQRAAGLVAPRDDEEVSFTRPTPAKVAERETHALLPANSAGFLRVLPPEFLSLAQASPVWKQQYWSAPSPWCRVEGQPDHPDFEANLKAFEGA